MTGFPARVLLATDGSRNAAVAAADLAVRAGSELHVVHAWHAETPSAYAVTLPGARSNFFRQKAEEFLEEQVAEIGRAGGEVARAHLRRGETCEGISGLAHELDAGLIVMGSRGLGPVRRMASGSVSERVVRRAERPVLVVPEAAPGGRRRWPPNRVVVAEDFSEDAVGAAELAASIGKLYGLRPLLVHVFPVLALGHKARVSGVSGIDAEVRLAHRALEELAGRLQDVAGRRPRTEVALGQPADTVLEIAEGGVGPALISTGSRGLGMLERLSSESVSTKIMRAADGPVLIYRRPSKGA